MAHGSAVLLVLAGCAGGSRYAAAVGPMFRDDGAGVALTLEASPVLFDQPSWTRAGGTQWRLSRSVGVAATAAVGTAWQSDSGTSAFAGGGVDLIPILHTSAARSGLAPKLAVGFGAHFGVGTSGDGAGAVFAVPRLWFSAAAIDSGRARYMMGGMFRCQFGRDNELTIGCGPAFVIARIRLNGSIPSSPLAHINGQ